MSALNFEMWTEDGDVLWLAQSDIPDPVRAKRLAFIGRGISGDPFGHHCSYDRLTATAEWASPLDENGEPLDGWAGKGETWFLCESHHPGAVLFWRIEEARSKGAAEARP